MFRQCALYRNIHRIVTPKTIIWIYIFRVSDSRSREGLVYSLPDKLYTVIVMNVSEVGIRVYSLHNFSR